MRSFQLLNKTLMKWLSGIEVTQVPSVAFIESPWNTAKGELVSLVCSAMLKYLVSRIYNDMFGSRSKSALLCWLK